MLEEDTLDRIAAALERIADVLDTQNTAAELSPRVVTVDQAAKRLGVAREKIRGWIADGTLTASNLSNSSKPRYAIEATSIDALVQMRRVDRPQQPTRRRRPLKHHDDRY